METESKGAIVSLCRDVFFGMRIRTMVHHLGRELRLCVTESDLAQSIDAGGNAALIIIDLNQPIDWDVLRPSLHAGIPTIGYASHTMVESFRTAKSEGITRMVSNGELSRSLPELIEKYGLL